MNLPIVLVLVAAGMLVAPIQTWLMLGGDLSEYMRYDTLPGQVPYVLSKLCALFSIEFVWLQALLGLLRRRLTQGSDLAPASWRRLHGTLGLAALAAMAAHVLLFVVGTSLRNRVAAIDLFLPWGHGAYRTWVAFGAAAMWLIMLGAAVQLWRLFRPPARLWLHRLVLVALMLVGVHSLAIGSESRSGLMTWAYGAMAISLGMAALDRFFVWHRGKGGRCRDDALPSP